jgi:hypothetical protein
MRWEVAVFPIPGVPGTPVSRAAVSVLRTDRVAPTEEVQNPVPYKWRG